MKKILQISILALLVVTWIMIGLSYSATINATSCSRAHVVAAIASATAGDTIQIPSGTCDTDWTSVVDVNKPLTIQGAGIDVTIITANVTGSNANNYIFRIPGYATDTYRSDIYGANQSVYAAGRWVFKDMTINAQYKSGHFFFLNRSDDYFSFQLSNLKLTGCKKIPASGFMYHNTVKITGHWQGLVSSNIITGNPYFKIMGPESAGVYAVFNQEEPAFGQVDRTIYFENNVITASNYNYMANQLGVCNNTITPITYDGVTGGSSYCGTNCDCDGGQGAISSNVGTKWVWRYNTYTTETARWGASVYFDHGPRGTDNTKYYSSTISSGETIEGVWYKIISTQPNHFCTGCVAGNEFKATSSVKTIDENNTVQIITWPFNTGVLNAEVYGNHFKIPNTTVYSSVIQRMSGQGMVFNNLVQRSGTASIYYSIDWPDNELGNTSQTMALCPTDSEHIYGGSYSCTVGGSPQHVYRSYDWNNRYSIDATGSGTSMSPSIGDTALVANTHFFSFNDCNGNTNCQEGTGCGTATPASCTVGTGFWKTTQSCSSLTSGTFGANPTTPISGTFYRCTSPNTWTEYYTPLQYPHPWVSTDTTAPVLLEGSVYPSGQQECTGDGANIDIGFSMIEASGTIVASCCLASETCTTSTTYASMTKPMTVDGLDAVLNDDWACGANYTVYCRAQDASGNESTTITIGFQTEANEDTTPPTLISQALGENGRTVTLTFSEPVSYGAGGSGGWTFTCDATPIALTYISGSDSTTLLYQTASCVASTATCTLDFAQPGNGIEDQAGNDFATIGDAVAIDNGSKQSCGAATSLFYPDVLTYTTHIDVASNLGVRFKTSVAGNLTDVCYYKDATLTGTHTASVWDDSCTLLGSKVIGNDTGTGWKCQALDAAIPLLANTYYRVAVHFPTANYIKVNNFFSTAYTESNLSVAAGGGRYFDSATIGCPTNSTNSNFLVDFIIAYAGATGPWNVTVSKTGAGCGVISQPITAIVDGETAEVVVTVNNGWAISVSDGCGSGSGTLSGNTYTYTSGTVTEDCEIAVTCAEVQLAPWVSP